MTKHLETKLNKLRQTWSRYQSSKEMLNTLKLETDILYDLYTEQAEKLAQELRRQNLNKIKTQDGTFKLKREVKAKITDRFAAETYDQEYNLGLFHKTVCGMRLKAWAKEQLQKGLAIPKFVDVCEQWTIEIEE
ncbi:MAG: hypothetical protein N2748_04550 [candidate division WOR-3 bacterium]|nr:hypothetical protein [candidate division WOR-3 bacterium]